MKDFAAELREGLPVLHPSSVEDVRAAVQAARHQGWKLLPVSTDCNWGYGAELELPPGHRKLNLSRMRRILNAEAISAAQPVAVVEPGVTQGQLQTFLATSHPGLTFNVTGSARETSLIGNALDRGVGYLGPRRDDLFGLEVVTGAGEVVQTGFRRLGDDSPLAHCHPFGLGPMLDGLFFQGNFGIVTSACFRLLPRPPRQLAVSLALYRAADLPRFIDVLAALKRERVMASVTHVGNQARTRASLQHGISDYLERECGLSGAARDDAAQQALRVVAPHEWTSLGGISGTADQVTAALKEVSRRMQGLARVTSFDDAKLAKGFALLHRLRRVPWARANAAAIAAIRPLNGLAAGVPTDAAIQNLLWRFGRSDLPAEQLLNSDCGVLFISPALSMDGAFVTDVVAGMTSLAGKAGLPLYVTINIETENSLVAVTNLLFNRADTAEAANAAACARRLHAYIRSRGLEVYRARNDMMDDIVDAASPYWQAVAALKRALDPDQVIAPGRYNIC